MTLEAGCSSWGVGGPPPHPPPPPPLPPPSPPPPQQDDEEDAAEEMPSATDRDSHGDVGGMGGNNSNSSNLMPPPPSPCSSPPYQPPAKRMRRDEDHFDAEAEEDADNLFEEGRESVVVPWQLVPHMVMSRVLSYLDDLDRCHASLACMAWRRAFNSPCLWRTRSFYFIGVDAMERQERYFKFLCHLGVHLRHANFDLGRPNIRTVSPIARGFETFVSRLSRCPRVRLLTIRMVSADLLSGWHFFSHNRAKLLRSVCNLLKKQPCLRTVDLSYSLMNRDDGTRVLEALTYGSRLRPKDRLTNVDLRQFFSPSTRVTSFARYAKVMAHFVALGSLRMDLLRLTYLGVENLADPDLLRGVDDLIVYLSNVFCNTLNKLHVQVRPDVEVAADTSLVRLVKRCLHLRDLSVNFAVQAKTFISILEVIHRNRADKVKGAKKTRFRLNVRGMTPELDQSIKNLTSGGGYSDVTGRTLCAMTGESRAS